MPFPHGCALRLLAPVLAVMSILASAVAADPPTTQYLLFQMATGGPDPSSGAYHRASSKADFLRTARHIADTVRPGPSDPDRILGFAVGPIAMDQGEDDARSVIRGAFDAALATHMAVELHLDDSLFWARAPERECMQNVSLPPPLCYESPEVRDFTTHWTRDVIGQEVKKQFDRLVEAAKAKLFAGVITGGESNLAHGYCSLSHLGYSAQNPPADFDHERERVLQRYIEH